MMTDESMFLIRESSRNLLKSNRQIHRDERNDIFRKLEKTRVTRETVVDIVNKLKTKSITSVEIDILKNAILDDQNSIAIVLSTPGSLRGLVRELSGTDVKKQLAAAGCCCNLALGDSKACVTLAKAAGPYLVTALDNFNTDLAVLCAWALGNAAGAGGGAGAALAARGLARALTATLAAAAAAPQRARAAVYAATRLAYTLKDELDKECVEKWTASLVKMDLDMESSQLLFILSCHADFALPQEDLYRVLQFTSVSIQKHCTECSGTDMCCELVYLLRTLANSDISEKGEIIINYFFANLGVESFKAILRSNNCTVSDSLNWLLGNVLNIYSENKFIDELFNADRALNCC